MTTLKTPNLPKFNLSEALNGKAIVTGIGQEAKIITQIRGKILVNVKSNLGSVNDSTILYNLDGTRWTGVTSAEDLYMAG